MFNNIGKKIKSLSVIPLIAFVLILIVCIILMAEVYIQVVTGLAIIILCGLNSLINSFLLYGFGQMIESTQSIENNLNKKQENNIT